MLSKFSQAFFREAPRIVAQSQIPLVSELVPRDPLIAEASTREV